MRDRKKFVALTSIAASGSMTILKLVVGLMTGSLGILSEAIHSLLDLTSATMTYFAVRVSGKPADRRHPYGHGKVEALSALFSTILLVLTSFWIIWEALHRLFGAAVEVEATWYAVALIVLVIGVDVSRSRALLKVARETGSQALKADALHYTSDILSSAAVLVGLGLVRLGWPQGDAIAALVVAVVVLWAAWHLGKAATDVLIDAAPAGLDEEVAAIVRSCEGVVSVERVRARQAGAVIFVEVLVRVSRTLSLERVEAIRHDILHKVQAVRSDVDVIVHALPLTVDDETIGDRVRAVAAAHGLSVHDIDLRAASGRTYLSFDVEVDEEVSIRTAHDAVTDLEHALVRDLGDDVVVDTHIDPSRSITSNSRQLSASEIGPITAIIRRVAGSLPSVRGIHNLSVGECQAGHHIAFHCTFDDEVPLRDAHVDAALMERRVHEAIPGVVRVVVHAEPAQHEDREQPISA